MCGIAGIMTRDGTPAPPKALAALSVAVAHRGPDGYGEHVVGGTGLLQRRLAIIDLKTGDQPLYGPDGTVLVANGEIYNYIELRREFPAADLKTSSDCELPLLTYRRDGAAFADTLRGMYAIALLDPASATLHLARDPFGIKPLYYVESEQGFAFASEPRALIAAGLATVGVRTEAARELLQTASTSGEETIASGIRRVLPGETMSVRDGRIVARRLRRALPSDAPLVVGEDEAVRQLDVALMNSVEVHQRSDVPYGMFLSGGIDSSALLACMARLNDKPVLAFTAGFAAASVADERAHAREVAKAVGARHIEIEVGERDFWDELPAVVAAVDDPTGDYAIIPTYFLARAAARELKVVLCGEGGDELFAGYGRYRRLLRPWWLGGRAARARGKLDGLGVLREEADTGCDRGRRAGRAPREGSSNWSSLQQAQAADFASWLPNDLLIKLDRCLMAHALEGRTPFLDPELAQFAFRLPDNLKVRGGLGKYLLRRWLEQHLPAAQPFARKRGFTVPVAEWMATCADRLAPLVARNDGVRQVCHPEAVERLIRSLATSRGKQVGMACWQLLFYAVWHRIHVEGAPRGSNLLSVL